MIWAWEGWYEHEQNLWSHLERSIRSQWKAQDSFSCRPVQTVEDLRGPGYSKHHRMKVKRFTYQLHYHWVEHTFKDLGTAGDLLCCSLCLIPQCIYSFEPYYLETIKKLNQTKQVKSICLTISDVIWYWKYESKNLKSFVALSSICIGEIKLWKSCLAYKKK